MSGSTQSQTTQETTKKPKRQPEKKIGPFANGVGVCVWLNTIETNSGDKKHCNRHGNCKSSAPGT